MGGTVCQRSDSGTAFDGCPSRFYQDHALSLAGKLGEPLSLALALINAACLTYFERRNSSAQQQAEGLIVLAIDQGFPFWIASGGIIRGWALMSQGRGREALFTLQQALEGYRATGASMVLPLYLSMLAEAHASLQQVEPGLQVIREAFAVIERTGEVSYAAELHRLQGDLLLMLPTGHHHTEAEQCFTQALEVARQQQARALELRAALSLGRLWQSQGKEAAATQLVSTSYRCFTEGFETMDVQAARTFLQEDAGTQ